MQTAGARAGRRESEIDPLAFEPLPLRFIRESLLLRFQRAFERHLCGVQGTACGGALVRRELEEGLAELSERSFAAEHVDPDGLQFFQRRGALDAAECGGLKLRDVLLDHVSVTLPPWGSSIVCCSSRSTIPWWPFVNARSSAAWLLSARACGSAPCARSSVAVSTSPFSAAAWSGVQPPCWRAFASAPCASRTAMTSLCRPEAAAWIGAFCIALRDRACTSAPSIG